jgi:Signal transduction histidine kinase regulating citrate/malate metabolism
MLERVLYAIGALLRILPFAVLGYVPLSDRLKISKKHLIACILGFMVIIAFCETVFYPIASSCWYPIFCCVIVCLLVFFTLVVNVHYTKSSFIFLFVTYYGSFVLGTTNYLYRVLIVNTGMKDLTANYIILYLLIFLVTIPVIIRILYFRVKPLLKMNNTKVWNNLWIIPFLYTITFAAFSVATNDNILHMWQFLTITLSMNISFMFICFLVLKMIIQTEENAVLRENANMTAMQVSFAEEQYKNLSRNIEKAKATRHDHRHHLLTIQALIQSNDLDHLNEYINEYLQIVSDDAVLTVCKNYAVNAIVQHYLKIADSEQIHTEVKISLPHQISVSNVDLCIIFGNLIENALEACVRMTSDTEKYIHIHARLKGKILGITVDNSKEGAIIKKGNKFISSKRDEEEGIGISSVKAVVEKYHGHIEFNETDKGFQVSILFHLP